MSDDVDTEYRRTSFRVATTGTAADTDLAKLVGNEMTVSLGGIVMADGIVTDVKIIEDGAALWVTVENGGAACALCGKVYPDGHTAGGGLRPVSDFAELLVEGKLWTKAFVALPLWVLICADQGCCEGRRRDAAAIPIPGGGGC